MRKWLVVFPGILGVGLLLQAVEPEKVDLGVLHRIKSEAFARNSKVMDTLFYLTDVYGPRLTGSPNINDAGNWAVKKMQEWGLVNVKMEKWGPFGRGWAPTRFAAMMKEPEFQPIIGFAQPWSPGTEWSGDRAGDDGGDQRPGRPGKVQGKVEGQDRSDRCHACLTAQRGGAVAPLDGRRIGCRGHGAGSGAGQSGGAAAGLPPSHGGRPCAWCGRARSGGGCGGRGGANPRAFRSQLNKFLTDEGVLVVLTPGNGPDGGTIMGQAAGSQNASEALPPPSVVITNEHYNRIARLLEKNLPVTLEFDIGAKFTEPADSFNLVAEIPGSNPNAGFVMLGGHFDSWTGGTGATDNAAGAAVAMEAMRILKTLDLKMARTVRLGLWTAEEQGLLGSRAYVKEHFADPADMKPKPEHAQLSAYYNLDNGSGKVRGIYVQDNDQARPIFESWIAPLKDLGVTTLTLRNTGSTDHISFDGVGLPAFQFIQDPLEYGTRTHHSNMDVYDHLQSGDLEQASAVMAWFVYNTATRPDMIPRNPMPKPGAGRGGRGN